MDARQIRRKRLRLLKKRAEQGRRSAAHMTREETYATDRDVADAIERDARTFADEQARR